ncbi:hypothetical protein [Pedococcus bigeumensis]|uniref:Integral membrane protein n=1 Tax=Pedococcus bigeumensis TaxID=433644 RepID=A0A502D0Z5_9MICO|nr:hypothetical protein [Pedococcus bigeumensis]TPG18430.1 hypothetical protein EAH86_07340 [Pedococcus bigeumensis]
MTTTQNDVRPRTARHPGRLGLRGVIAVSLVVDAVVHLRLAGGYQQSAPGGIGAGNLFRLEAIFAIVVSGWVLWRGSRASLVAAFAVGFSAALAVVLYRYVDVPALGPIPAMYEPVWFFEKSLSAVFEVMAAASAVAALALVPGRRRARTHRGNGHTQN